jgi:hypothetical protein
MVTVLAGVGGLGKSQWTAWLAAQNPGFTLIATAEDSPAVTVRPRLEAVGADLDRLAFVKIQSDDGLEDGITIPTTSTFSPSSSLTMRRRCLWSIPWWHTSRWRSTHTRTSRCGGRSRRFAGSPTNMAAPSSRSCT